MSETLVLTASEVQRLLAEGTPHRIIDVRGRAAYRRATERVDGDVRAHGVGMMQLVAGQPDDTLYLLYCT